MKLKEIIKEKDLIQKESMTDTSIQIKHPQSAGSRGLKHLRKKIDILEDKWPDIDHFYDVKESQLILKRPKMDDYLVTAIKQIADQSKAYPEIIARIYEAITGDKTTYNPKYDSYTIDK